MAAINSRALRRLAVGATLPHALPPARLQRAFASLPSSSSPRPSAAAASVSSSSTSSSSSSRSPPSTLYHSHAESSVFDVNKDVTSGAKIGEVVLTTKFGHDLLLDPLLNKGTSFPMEERERLAIRGLVPPRLPEAKGQALKKQMKRIMDRYFELPTPLAKYGYVSNIETRAMVALQDRNEVLFYCCLIDHLEELAPIIYTPTVGLACQSFSSIFRRPRGMYFSAADKGVMHAMMWNWPTSDVEIIVVTDGSRILGLGDLGTNGMGIPIGKLSLYTAAAGIHPSKTLPALIDVGTNNDKLLSDPMYLGLTQRRVTGQDYLDIVDEFIRAVRERFPAALVQFEDFANDKASLLLDKYRDSLLCFNDDIQGTGCVVVAAALGALRAMGAEQPGAALKEQRIVVLGAGSAGLGVASFLKFAMMKEGLTEQEASERFWIIDKDGLLGLGRENLNKDQRHWTRSTMKDGSSFIDVVNTVKPTILIGLSGVGGLFSEEAIKAMAKHCEQPIILALSNPTSAAECTAEQAYNWTDGKALFACGSPFPPVDYKGKKLVPCQANNMYTFPGIGLGALSCQARSITDAMIYAAAKGLAGTVSDADFKEGRIFPRLSSIPRVSDQVALAVCKQAVLDGVARLHCPDDERWLQLIRGRKWEPMYGQIVRMPVL